MSKQIFQKFDVEFRKKVIVPTPEGVLSDTWEEVEIEQDEI